MSYKDWIYAENSEDGFIGQKINRDGFFLGYSHGILLIDYLDKEKNNNGGLLYA